MKLIAFIEGRPKPQPRVTQGVKFLFSKSVEQWAAIDADNAIKAAHGLLNKKGNPYKETRYSYRLARLQAINEYRANVYDVVCRACNNGVWVENCEKIPKQNLFFFFMFHCPTRWKKQRRIDELWKPHEFKPDTKNLYTAVEDAMYKSDSECSNTATYKIYVPDTYKEGTLILHNEEIHQYIIDFAKQILTKC